MLFGSFQSSAANYFPANSRTPVRSALHRLEQEGYIVSAGWDNERRLLVAPMTEDDVRELFQIVAEIEGLAARLAAKRPAKQRTALTSRLRRINEEIAATGRSARPDPSRYFELDMAFHRTYVEFGASPAHLSPSFADLREQLGAIAADRFRCGV